MLLHFGGTKNVVSFLSPGRVSDWAADVPFVTTNGSPFARAVLFPSKERERESLACNIHIDILLVIILQPTPQSDTRLSIPRVWFSLSLSLSLSSFVQTRICWWFSIKSGLMPTCTVLYTLLFFCKLIDIGRDWSPALARINCGFTPDEPNFHTNCFACFLFLSFSNPEDFSNVLHFRTWRFRTSRKKRLTKKKNIFL
jgi:hypothetical protein